MTSAVPAVLASASAVAAVTGLRRTRLDARTIVRLAGGTGIVGRTRRGAALSRALGRAGWPVSADAFVAITAAAAAALALAVWRVIGTPAVALLATSGVLFGAHALVASSDRRYLARFAGQLPVLAQQLSGAIGAGQSLRQAIRRASLDAPEPAASELRSLTADLDLGARVDQALEATVRSLPDPGWRIMVTAILVQRVAGGNLAQALADLSARLEDRAALEREARSATAQARMSAWLVASLPLAAGGVVELAAPGTLARTVGRGPGLALLLLATGLEIVGVLLIRRIVGREGGPAG